MNVRTLAAAMVVLVGSLTAATAQMMPGGWNGFYAGVNLGGGWASATDNLTPAGCFATVGGCGLTAGGGGASRGFSQSLNSSGILGGVQGGYNWQVNPWLVLGVETDFEGSDVGTSRSSSISLAAPLTGSATVHTSTNQDYFGTVRGRLGFLATPDILLFGTGGFAYGEQSHATTVSFTRAGDVYSGSTSSLRTGWAAGGGAEWAFAPQWSVKAEYIYVDLGSGTNTINVTNPVTSGVASTSSFRSTVNGHEDVFLVGVNYHFGAPLPPPPAPAAMPAPPPPAAPRVFIVFFDWDKDVITPEGEQIIQQAAAAYNSGAPVQLQVTGYTDRSGSVAYNQRLSERRASNVARALAALGVPREQMVVSGRGENDNRVPTANGVREPQNRRVEILS